MMFKMISGLDVVDDHGAAYHTNSLPLVGRVRVGVAPAFVVKKNSFNVFETPSAPHPGPPHKGEGEEIYCLSRVKFNA